jgi:hypothetical protein
MSDIGGMSECDYSNKYNIKNGETQFTVQMEETGVISGARRHGQWRPMERVQKYRCTDVQTYRSTEVQTYKSTDAQMYRCIDKCCCREDGGSWFNKKGTQA